MSRSLRFQSDEAKWAFLARAPELDRLEPAVRRLAGLLWEAAGRQAERFVRLAAAYCRDVIHYGSDVARTGTEDIPPVGELWTVISRGVDDCDAKARLFVALCRAVGLEAAMVPVWKPGPFGRELAHVFAQVVLAGRPRDVELTLSRARVGDRPEDVPRETRGPDRGRWDRNEVRP